MAQRTKTLEFALATVESAIAGQWDSVQRDANGVFTDLATAANNATTADMTMGGATTDKWYFGMTSQKFAQLRILLSTNGVGGTVVWEYWNGSTWAALSPTADTGSANLTGGNTHVLSWTVPTDWATTAINSLTRYWVRGRVSVAFSTAPIGSQAWVAALAEFTQKTIYIPETASRTIRSAVLQITGRGPHTAVNDLMSWITQYKVGSGSWTNKRVIDTLTNTGETQTYLFTVDVLDKFVADFSGASQTLDVKFGMLSSAASVGALINVTCKLIITYEFDDASATTRIKTVRIPIESLVGDLGTVNAEIGTNQIPNLDTFLPEASKVYRDVFLEVMANEANAGTTDSLLQLALDGGATDGDGNHENALQSAVWYKFIWDLNSMTKNAAHALKAWRTGSSVFNTAVFILTVTYEYDHSSSTSIMNSIMLPFEIPSPIGGVVQADASRYQRKFMVEEPATIALVQSGVRLHFNETANIAGLNVKVGSQTARAYTHVSGTVACGMYNLMQRIDSGAAGGAGLTLARGENTITIDVWRTDTTDFGTNINGCIYLNYTSGKHASGDGVHAHTIVHCLTNTQADNVLLPVAATAPIIPETNYWLGGLGFEIDMMGTGDIGLVFSMEKLSGEGAADGWEDIYADAINSAAEFACTIIFVRARDAFKRYPADPDSDRSDVETARKYQLYTNANVYAGICMFLTYHSMTKTIAGTVAGYTSGDGSGITVDIFRADTDEKIGSVTTSAGGGYTFTWYDDTINCYAVARNGANQVGRSDDATAS